MDSQQYYLNSFSHDVSRMKLREGSPYVKYLLLQDEHATFFGGVQWETWIKDLKEIGPDIIVSLGPCSKIVNLLLNMSRKNYLTANAKASIA